MRCLSFVLISGTAISFVKDYATDCILTIVHNVTMGHVTTGMHTKEFFRNESAIKLWSIVILKPDFTSQSSRFLLIYGYIAAT